MVSYLDREVEGCNQMFELFRGPPGRWDSQSPILESSCSDHVLWDQINTMACFKNVSLEEACLHARSLVSVAVKLLSGLLFTGKDLSKKEQSNCRGWPCQYCQSYYRKQGTMLLLYQATPERTQAGNHSQQLCASFLEVGLALAFIALKIFGLKAVISVGCMCIPLFTYGTFYALIL